MSYRITEASRNHVPICKDIKLSLSINKDSSPTNVILNLSDGDQLNTAVDLPDYELQFEVENMIIKLKNNYTGRICPTAFLGTWHWLFQGLFEEWNGKRYIHSIRFFRDDDKYEIIEPVNVIWNLETNNLLADIINAKTITVDNLVIKNQIPPEKRPPGWNPGDPITIDIIKQFPNDTAVTMEMLKTVINDYEQS